MRCPSWSVSAPLLAATLAFVAPSLAAAGPPATGSLSAANKRFRFHVGTDLFSLVHENPDGGDSDLNTNRLGFGIGRRTWLDTPTAFVGAGVASLGFSGILLDGHIGVGGMFAFTVDGIDVGDDGGTLIEGRFVPFFNYMFNPAGRVTPFVGLHLGLGGGAGTDTIDDPITGESIRRTVSVIYPVVGPQGGVHIFVIPAVSVDVMVNFDYIAPHVRFRQEDSPSEDDDYDKVSDIINVAFINVGLSAWF